MLQKRHASVIWGIPRYCNMASFDWVQSWDCYRLLAAMVDKEKKDFKIQTTHSQDLINVFKKVSPGQIVLFG